MNNSSCLFISINMHGIILFWNCIKCRQYHFMSCCKLIAQVQIKTLQDPEAMINITHAYNTEKKDAISVFVFDCRSYSCALFPSFQSDKMQSNYTIFQILQENAVLSHGWFFFLIFGGLSDCKVILVSTSLFSFYVNLVLVLAITGHRIRWTKESRNSLHVSLCTFQ